MSSAPYRPNSRATWGSASALFRRDRSSRKAPRRCSAPRWSTSTAQHRHQPFLHALVGMPSKHLNQVVELMQCRSNVPGGGASGPSVTATHRCREPTSPNRPRRRSPRHGRNQRMTACRAGSRAAAGPARRGRGQGRTVLGRGSRHRPPALRTSSSGSRSPVSTASTKPSSAPLTSAPRKVNRSVPRGVLTGRCSQATAASRRARFRMISCQLDEMDLPVRIDGNDPHDRPVRRGTGHQDPGWHDTALRRTAKFRPRRPRRSDRSGARSGGATLLSLPLRRIGHHTVFASKDTTYQLVELSVDDVVVDATPVPHTLPVLSKRVVVRGETG